MLLMNIILGITYNHDTCKYLKFVPQCYYIFDYLSAYIIALFAFNLAQLPFLYLFLQPLI